MSVPVGKGGGANPHDPGFSYTPKPKGSDPGFNYTPKGTPKPKSGWQPFKDHLATPANHAKLAAIATKLTLRPMQVVAGKPTHKAPNHVVTPGQVGNGKLGLSNDLPPRSTYNSGDLNV